MAYLSLKTADSLNRNLNLERAQLVEAKLMHMNLNWANLKFADLSGAYLSGAYLYYADLSGADLREATNLTVYQLGLAKKLQGARFNSELEKQVIELYFHLFKEP